MAPTAHSGRGMWRTTECMDSPTLEIIRVLALTRSSISCCHGFLVCEAVRCDGVGGDGVGCDGVGGDGVESSVAADEITYTIHGSWS